jgi:hypothetical protein
MSEEALQDMLAYHYWVWYGVRAALLKGAVGFTASVEDGGSEGKWDFRARFQIMWPDAVEMVVGEPPKKEGDYFEASVEPPPEPAPRRRGCEFGVTADGAAFIQCTRGGYEPTYYPEVKKYKYDPKIHEIVEGGA